MATPSSPWPMAPMQDLNAPPGVGSGPFMPPTTAPQPTGAMPDLYGGFAGGIGSGGTAPMGGIDLYQPAGAKGSTPPMAFDQLLGGGSGPFMPPPDGQDPMVQNGMRTLRDGRVVPDTGPAGGNGWNVAFGGAPGPTPAPPGGGSGPFVPPPTAPTTQTATGAPATGQTAGGWQTSPITDMSEAGFQNWAQQTFGYQYSPQELQQIAQEVGYSGSGPISGEQMASAQQAAMRRAQARGWEAPNDRTRLTVEDAPTFEAPELNQPDPYAGPGEFRAPTLEEMQADPGYQFRTQEGERAIRNAASALGGTRGSNHLVDLLRYGQEMGSQEYGNIYNRAADTFERNRRTGLDVYDRGRQAGLDAYDAAFRGAESEYAPRYDTWTARNRASELNIEDDWRREVYAGDSAYRDRRAAEEDRRYREEADWRSRVYGDSRRDRMTDEQWRQYLADEDRRRYLVDRGA